MNDPQEEAFWAEIAVYERAAREDDRKWRWLERLALVVCFLTLGFLILR